MLFRVMKAYCDEHDDGNMLGFAWVEALAVVPCGVEKLKRSKYRKRDRWVYDYMYVVRTELGIHHIHADDLHGAIDDGFYVEGPAIVFDPDTQTVKLVVDSCQNGIALQHTTESWEGEGEIEQ